MTARPDERLNAILRFRADRDWQQFHTPRTLAASLAIESAELLEIFQWTSDAELDTVVAAKRERIEEELADVAIYLLPWLTISTSTSMHPSSGSSSRTPRSIPLSS